MKGRFESIDIRAKNLFFFLSNFFFIEYAEEEEAEKIIIEKKTIIFHSTGGPPNLFNVGLYMLRALCVYIYRRGGGRSGFTFDRIFTHTHTAVYTLYVSGVASNAHTIFCVEFQRADVLFIPSYPFFFSFPISPPGCIIYLIFVWPTVGVAYKKKIAAYTHTTSFMRRKKIYIFFL